MLDKASCREWAQKVKADPSGFTGAQIRLPAAIAPTARSGNRVLSPKELIAAFARDSRTAARRSAGTTTSWSTATGSTTCARRFSSPRRWNPSSRSGSRTRCRSSIPNRGSGSGASSNVPICTGENLARRQGFKDFIINQGCDILHPDLRNTGGFLETKRIADMADMFGLPMANHNTGSQVFTYSDACQWAASIRDYIACETITGQGGWMDQVLVLENGYIKGGFIQMADKPGLGIESESGRREGPPCARRTVVGIR